MSVYTYSYGYVALTNTLILTSCSSVTQIQQIRSIYSQHQDFNSGSGPVCNRL